MLKELGLFYPKQPNTMQRFCASDTKSTQAVAYVLFGVVQRKERKGQKNKSSVISSMIACICVQHVGVGLIK